MNELISGVRSQLRRRGWDVVRWPGNTVGAYRQALLEKFAVDIVLDVGANRGQYALSLREWGFEGQILSFEPLRDAFEKLAAQAAVDSCWQAHKVALASSRGATTMHVAANGGASSSILNMLETHERAAPAATVVGQETVRKERLDTFFDPSWSKALLKLDVQGFEQEVLNGASRTLDVVDIVEMELTLQPLYEGGLLFDDAMGIMGGHGFALADVRPMFRQPETEVLLQADGIFVRRQLTS